jgi:hypothetical protein
LKPPSVSSSILRRVLICVETPTKEVFDQRPIHRRRLEVSKRNKRRRHLAQAEALDRVGEAVLGVERLGVDLPRDLGVGHVRRRDERLGPVAPRLVEDGLVEDVVAAEEGVGAAEAGVVLEDVVPVEMVTGDRSVNYR